MLPVLYEIEFNGDKGLFCMNDGFSAYDGEDEVLIQDGLEYRVVDNYQEVDQLTQKRYHFIKLRYPPGK